MWSLIWLAITKGASVVGGALWSAITWAFANPAPALCIVLACGWVWTWRSSKADLETATKALVAMVADRDREAARADKSEEGRKTALAANAQLAVSLGHLEEANRKATDLAAAAKLAGDAALVSLRRARADLAASSARENALRGQLYASDPDVNAWGAQRVPPALAARLLESARSTAGP